MIYVTGVEISSLESKLNTALELLSTWISRNEFKVNTDKTIFHPFNLLIKHHFIDKSVDKFPWQIVEIMRR